MHGDKNVATELEAYYRILIVTVWASLEAQTLAQTLILVTSSGRTKLFQPLARYVLFSHTHMLSTPIFSSLLTRLYIQMSLTVSKCWWEESRMRCCKSVCVYVREEDGKGGGGVCGKPGPSPFLPLHALSITTEKEDDHWKVSQSSEGGWTIFLSYFLFFVFVFFLNLSHKQLG